MKYKFTILALLLTIPGLVWAGTNFLNTNPVYVIAKADHEDAAIVPMIRNYRLEWNQVVGKFELMPGTKRRPITLEESMQPTLVDPSQADEPIRIYYGDDFSI